MEAYELLEAIRIRQGDEAFFEALKSHRMVQARQEYADWGDIGFLMGLREEPKDIGDSHVPAE